MAGRRRVELARREGTNLIERAGRHHGVEARVDAAQEFVALRHEEHLCGPGEIDDRRLVGGVPIPK